MHPSHPSAGREQPEHLLLFDGVCHLCHSAVQFVLRRDTSGSICFASLQSEYARRLLAGYGCDAAELKSVVYLEGAKLYTRSDAVLRVVQKLGGGWRALCTIGLAIPRFIRDPLYEWVARHRYRWFGKHEHCLLPSPDVRSRFLD